MDLEHILMDFGDFEGPFLTKKIDLITNIYLNPSVTGVHKIN